MFFKDTFDCHVETRLTGEMGESDDYSRNNRNLGKDRKSVMIVYQLFFLFPLYIKSTSKLGLNLVFCSIIYKHKSE